MQVPPEITVKGISMTPYIDKLITRGITKLEKVCDYIISTRIALEQVQGRHQTGNPYRMQIDIRIPARPDIIVERSSQASKKLINKPGRLEAEPVVETELDLDDPRFSESESIPRQKVREEPLQALIRRTFDSAIRELQKTVDKQHGNIKTSAQSQAQAFVEKIFRDKQYGFLRTVDGQQVYFHKNSVLHKHWDHLSAGTAVRYTSELGEKGLQASTVELVNKPGVAEMHSDLHELAETN